MTTGAWARQRDATENSERHPPIDQKNHQMLKKKKKQQIINEEYASWTRMAYQMREELKAELTHVA
jgi:hypothetical protein